MDINIINPVTKEKIGEVINGALSATPNDADLVMSVDTSVAKKNTWTQIKAFLKTYFDTVYQATGTYLTSANITQTITSGVTDKAPSEDAVYDALALKSDKGFVICGGWATTAPADATTYYANSIAVALNAGLTNIQAFYIPKNCTLKAAFINVISGAASNETVTYNAYIGGSATLIATDNNTLTNFTISNTAMSLSCTQGQEVKLQIITPTWGTNPVSHRGSFTFYFE